MTFQDEALAAIAKALATRHNFRDPSPYLPDAKVALEAILKILGSDTLDEIMDELNQANPDRVMEKAKMSNRS